MGYSCSSMANAVFKQIRKILRESGPETNRDDQYWYAGKWHWWYISRERNDGAIVGPVYEIIETPEGQQTQRVGSFHVNKDGRIIRFPGSTKKQRIKAEREGIRQYFETSDWPPEKVERRLQEHIELFLTKE